MRLGCAVRLPLSITSFKRFIIKRKCAVCGEEGNKYIITKCATTNYSHSILKIKPRNKMKLHINRSFLVGGTSFPIA